MKKIGIAFILTLLLVGCGNQKEYEGQTEYEKQHDDKKYGYSIKLDEFLNCYYEFYKDAEGNRYFVSATKIQIKFKGQEWMNLNDAFEQNKITKEKFVENEKEMFNICTPGQTGYPCDEGCL